METRAHVAVDGDAHTDGRARRSIDARRPRFAASEESRQALAARFFAAVISGDLERLLALLAADATFRGDGGGKARAFPRTIRGARSVARLLIGLSTQMMRLGVTIAPARVNGQPGALTRDATGRIVSAIAVDVLDDGTVHAVHSVVNPDKLGHLGPVSDLGRLPA
jgi:RNA polymerase sigma-70 factor, ECF subfamily